MKRAVLTSPRFAQGDKAPDDRPGDLAVWGFARLVGDVERSCQRSHRGGVVHSSRIVNANIPNALHTLYTLHVSSPARFKTSAAPHRPE